MKENKDTQIRIGGRGGQGILLLGKLLAYGALLQGKFAASSPSIGPEPRGGISSCDVVLSNTAIDYPRATSADVFIALSKAAYDRYVPSLAQEGVVFYDPLFLRLDGKLSRHYAIPCAEAAHKELKSIAGAGIALLGAVARLSRVVSLDALTKSLRINLPQQTLAQNLKAFELGAQLAKKVKYP